MEGTANGSPVQKMSKGTRAALIVGSVVGVGATVALVMAFNRIGTLEEGLMNANQRAKTIDSVVAVQRGQIERLQRADSLLRVDTYNLKGTTWAISTGTRKEFDSLGNHVGELTLKAAKTDSAVDSIKADIGWLKAAIDALKISDDALRNDLEKIGRTVDSEEKAGFKMQLFLDMNAIIGKWNTHRGGFPIFGGGRKELPPMSREEFLNLYPRDLSPELSLVVAFTNWCGDNGVKAEDAQKWAKKNILVN